MKSPQMKVLLMDDPHPARLPITYSRASVTTTEFIEMERQQGRKPVALGDVSNTIIFIDEKRNAERAVKSFIERVDQHRTSSSFMRRDGNKDGK